MILEEGFEPSAAAVRSAARRGLAAITSRPRQAACWQQVTTRGDGRVVSRIDPSTGAFGVEGVWRCAYLSCPECSARIARTRAVELEQAIAVQEAFGGSVAFVTLTLRHHNGQRLVELHKALSKGGAAIWSGRAGQAIRDEIEGFVRVLELTHGGHGFHPHYHMVLFLPGRWSEAGVESLGRRMHARFADELARHGCESWADHGGLDVQLVRLREEVPALLGDYLAKQVYVEDEDSVALVSNAGRLSMEALGAAFKLGRRNRLTGVKGRGMFEVLEDVLVGRLLGLGDTAEVKADLAVWHEIEQFYATARPRQWSWSRARPSRGEPSLRELIREKAKALGMDVEVAAEERSEEDIVAEEDEGLIPVFDVPEGAFYSVLRYEIEDLRHTTAAAQDPVMAAWWWFRDRGVDVQWSPGWGDRWAWQARVIEEYLARRARGDLPTDRAVA